MSSDISTDVEVEDGQNYNTEEEGCNILYIIFGFIVGVYVVASSFFTYYSFEKSISAQKIGDINNRLAMQQLNISIGITTVLMEDWKKQNISMIDIQKRLNCIYGRTSLGVSCGAPFGIYLDRSDTNNIVIGAQILDSSEYERSNKHGRFPRTE